MLPKESIITPEIVREREDRHRRLMKMIRNFKRTSQEVKKLERIKDNTILEINLRHIRSEHNRNYRFPKDFYEHDDQEIPPSDNPFLSRQTTVYDLRTQNEVHQSKSKQVSFENGRRVKSLDQQKNDISSQRLGRFQQAKHQLSQKRIRKKSLAEQKRVYSTIKLPELGKKEKMKTQSKNDSFELQKIVGKKLATESNSPKGKNPALTKYLEKQSRAQSKKRLQGLKKIQ